MMSALQDWDSQCHGYYALLCTVVYKLILLQSVWGSFWRDGRWGYKCCHSLVKESYCTGEAGIVAEQV